MNDLPWPGSSEKEAGSSSSNNRSLENGRSLPLQMLREKSQHRLFGLLGIRTTKAMTGSFHGQQLRFNISRFEPINKPDRLLMSHIWVLGVVNAKRRRRTGCDPVKRAGH